MKEVRFQSSLIDSLLDMTPDMMIAGVVIALMLSLATAYLYILWQRRKRVGNSAAVLASVMLVPVLAAMVLCVGFERYQDDKRSAPTGAFRPLRSGSDRFGGDREHGHWWRFGRRSFTRAFFELADTNDDGKISPEETAQLVKSADADEDGLMDAAGLESALRKRFESFAHAAVESEGRGEIETEATRVEPELTGDMAQVPEPEPEPAEAVSESRSD